MATSKKFSELPAASSVGNGDLFAIAHEDAQAETGYVSQKLTAAQAGQKVNGDTEYPTSLPSFPENGQNPFAALEKLNQDIIDLYPVSTASGSIANFSTSLALPLVGLSSTIVAQQAGSGTPSPSNPRAISGYNEVVLTHTGKNMLEVTATSGRSGSVDFIVNSDGSVTANIPAERVANAWFPVATGINIAAGSILSGGKSADIFIQIINSQGTQLYKSGLTEVTITEDLTNVTVRLGVYIGIVSQTYKFLPMIRTSGDSTWEPYNGETKTIALGQTVYGGSVDAKSGKAYATTKYFSFTEAQYYGTYGADNANLYFVDIPDYATDAIKSYADTGAGDVILISNLFVKNSTSSGSSMLNNQIRTQAGSLPTKIYFRADEFADLTALNAFLANTPLQVVAELQTPEEITGLTTGNFTTLAGEQNNIYADCGDVSVSFKQGIQEYIDAKIAETQALVL